MRDLTGVGTDFPGTTQAPLPQQFPEEHIGRHGQPCKIAVRSTVLDAIAPGNVPWLLQQVVEKYNRTQGAEGVVEGSLVSRLVVLYDEANSWYTRQQILSIFAGDYTKTELIQLIPGLTKWRIDEARKHAFQTKPGQPLEAPTLQRSRLDAVKVDHFLDFVSSPSFLQDVAYGTKTLKLSSGERVEIPNVVRTLIASRLIQLYIQYCDESGFDTMGRSTLFNILKVCAASQKKSLAGLDSTQTDGVCALASLEETTRQLCQLVISNYQTAKNCFKIRYSYVVRSNDEKREELQHDVECAVPKLEDWKSHILRAAHQDAAKSTLIDGLLQTQVLIIMDWAMKFLPTSFRETQRDWFGKKGKPWHVSVAITKDENGETETRTYIHLFEECTQNWFAVASIVEHTLKSLKATNPQLTEAFLRSDNAGCYHCAFLLLSLPNIGQNAGINISRYDFSEPQAGKDICDRRTAAVKSHMRRYINEGHDIKTAGDMKAAIESHEGVKGC
ncbi:hypothetical protein QZH41_010219, partial [Actinostola sp. cb2023]